MDINDYNTIDIRESSPSLIDNSSSTLNIHIYDQMKTRSNHCNLISFHVFIDEITKLCETSLIFIISIYSCNM